MNLFKLSVVQKITHEWFLEYSSEREQEVSQIHIYQEKY